VLGAGGIVDAPIKGKVAKLHRAQRVVML